MGIIFAALLQQRGILALHASTVAINNEAVAFLGWKGMGKSTTAAFLYRRGHTMISDDIVAIESLATGSSSILPGIPSFKLMPETVACVLGDNPNHLSQIHTGAEKRFRSSSDNFLKSSIPIKAIYLLADGTRTQTQLLKPQEAISSLIAHTYLARFGEQLLQNNQAITNLRQCSNIVNHVPVFRLERPRALDLLDSLAELIESESAISPQIREKPFSANLP